jgi:hypothetical protein
MRIGAVAMAVPRRRCGFQGGDAGTGHDGPALEGTAGRLFDAAIKPCQEIPAFA